MREAPAHQVGVDEAEVRAAHAHARGRHLDAQRIGQRFHRRFGRRVGRHERRVAGRGQRRDVEQVALSLGDVGQHCAVGAPDAHQVHVEDPLDLLDRRRRQRADVVDAGVGDGDVERAEAAERRLHGALERVSVADVGLEPRGALAEPGGVRLEQVGLEAHERHVGAPGV